MRCIPKLLPTSVSILAATVVAGFLTAVPLSSAHALLTLLADSDGSCSLTTFANCDVVVIDGNTGPSAPATVKDLDGALDDEILFQAVTTEFSKVRVSADADFFPPFSGLDYVWDIEGGAGETLMVWISETDYDAPIGDLLALVEADGNTVSTFDSDVTIQAWIDDGNNLFGMGCSVGSDSDTDGNTDIDATINGSCVGIGRCRAHMPY